MSSSGSGLVHTRFRRLASLRTKSSSAYELARFRRAVWKYWRENGRHDLPWRKTTDPYRIMVSEVMLQQTQVPRVIGKYKEFLKRFPSVSALARAPLSDVLRAWSGLGYNRRGKYLHDAAKEIVGIYKGNFRQALEHPLPGVGPYTKAAVRAFAFNQPDVLIETNVRAAFIHNFHSNVLQNVRISDAEIIPLATLAAKGQDPREWNWALMDYGAHLKRSGIRNNSRSAHYTKQSKFEGSLRQIRGAILRDLHEGKKPKSDSPLFKEALAGLVRDGLIKKEKGRWRIA